MVAMELNALIAKDDSELIDVGQRHGHLCLGANALRQKSLLFRFPLSQSLAETIAYSHNLWVRDDFTGGMQADISKGKVQV